MRKRVVRFQTSTRSRHQLFRHGERAHWGPAKSTWGALRPRRTSTDVVIAAKVNDRCGKRQTVLGFHAAIMTEIDDSLRRLGTDYIDLYQIHRWDPKTPIEETMETLNDLVRSGKVRYLGASSMWAWQCDRSARCRT